jgi:hypothetical protein
MSDRKARGGNAGEGRNQRATRYAEPTRLCAALVIGRDETNPLQSDFSFLDFLGRRNGRDRRREEQ